MKMTKYLLFLGALLPLLLLCKCSIVPEDGDPCVFYKIKTGKETEAADYVQKISKDGTGIYYCTEQAMKIYGEPVPGEFTNGECVPKSRY